MIKRKIKVINTRKEAINFTELIEPFTKRWYFYILALIISLSSVYLYVRYTIPIYLNSASIIINEENGKGGNGNINVLEELELVPSSSNLMNEMGSNIFYKLLHNIKIYGHSLIQAENFIYF